LLSRAALDQSRWLARSDLSKQTFHIHHSAKGLSPARLRQTDGVNSSYNWILDNFLLIPYEPRV
jgi:hypothetical protein